MCVFSLGVHPESEATEAIHIIAIHQRSVVRPIFVCDVHSITCMNNRKFSCAFQGFAAFHRVHQTT